MKLVLIPLSILLGVAFGAKWGHLPHEPKNAEHHGLGIISGKTVPIGKYPYMVSIVTDGTLWGSGAILDKNWVITTAFNAQWLDTTTIRAGSQKWKTGGQSPKIDSAVLHPNYTGAWDNNVALLKLATPLNLSKKVQTIALGTTLPTAGTAVQVSGWGEATEGSMTASNLLREADNAILADKACSTALAADYADSLFCTKVSEAGPCVYDFGDPLVSGSKLYGLYGGGNDCSKDPRVYSNIPKLADWINSVISS